MFKHVRHIILLAVLTATFAAGAQTAPYKFDFGADVGMSGYIGEASGSNPFRHPGIDADLAMRYIHDARWAVRGMLSTSSLKGSTADVANALPDGKVYDFNSQVFGLEVRGEFNFFSYGIGETYKRLRRVSPYLTLGLGVDLALSDGHVAATPTIPMGFGVKYKLRERINLMAEFSMTKTFNDKMDSAEMTDLNQIKTAFYKNTDWISRLTVGISFEFGKRCETCHYVD